MKYLFPMILGLVNITYLVIFSDNLENANAVTYYTNWWLGYSNNSPPEQSAGLLHLYYTYPDFVFTGQNFSVGITLEYVKDNRAILDWIVFSKVSVGLKDILGLASNDSETYPEDIISAADNTSRIVRPGEQYSYSLPLTAPSSPGQYLIFPRWNAYYGPGTTADNNFDWKMEYYYNQTGNQFGKVYPYELPPIKVSDKRDQKNIRNVNLTVFINSPYSSIKPIDVSVETSKEYGPTYHNVTQEDGSVLFHLPINTTYAITVPAIIDIIPGKIRAVFVNWTDGQEFGSLNYDNTRNITRIVHLQHDLELVPTYKTQYYLIVRSNEVKNTNNNNGTGWYDSGNDAQFSINTLNAFLTLRSFDHWNGTIPTGENTATSGTIHMNGPKDIIAIWKFDFGYLALILGIVTASITIIGKIISRKQTFFKLIRRFGIWIKR